MRQHPPGPELALEALVIDEAVDPLQHRLQVLGQIEIRILLSVGGKHFENDRKHCLVSLFVISQEGTGATSSPQRKQMLSRHNPNRIASKCIKCVPRLILISRFTGAPLNASKSQRASSSGI